MIYIWVGQWEELQKNRMEEGRKRQEGIEINWMTFCKEIGMFLSRCGLPYNFPVTVLMPKRKQVITPMAADEWVLILCSGDQTPSKLSEVTHCCSPPLQYYILKHKTTLHLPHTIVLSKICVNSHATKRWRRWKAEINGVITGFQENHPWAWNKSGLLQGTGCFKAAWGQFAM